MIATVTMVCQEKLQLTRRERVTTLSCEELSGSRSFATTRNGILSSPDWVEFWPRRELIALCGR